MTAVSPFAVAGGTTSGARHAAAGRNNQDAFAWAESPAGLVALVCDGCGSARDSEVGAKIGSRLLVAAIARRLGSREVSTALGEARLEVVETLRGLSLAMSAEPGTGVAKAVAEFFLFTVVGVVVAHDQVTPFSLGDGVIVVNGERRVLGPYPDNEPPYLGYELVQPGAPRPFELHDPIPVAEVRSVLLGTDGALDLDDLAPFCADTRFVTNTDQVRRRLVLVGREAGGTRLPDDTTVVVLQKREGSS